MTNLVLFITSLVVAFLSGALGGLGLRWVSGADLDGDSIWSSTWVSALVLGAPGILGAFTGVAIAYSTRHGGRWAEMIFRLSIANLVVALPTLIVPTLPYYIALAVVTTVMAEINRRNARSQAASN